MEDGNTPRESEREQKPLIRSLTIAATALTAASIVVNLILQIADFLQKRPIERDQRDKADAAGLVLNVLRRLPGLVKHVRLLVDQLRPAS